MVRLAHSADRIDLAMRHHILHKQVSQPQKGARENSTHQAPMKPQSNYSELALVFLYRGYNEHCNVFSRYLTTERKTLA